MAAKKKTLKSSGSESTKNKKDDSNITTTTTAKKSDRKKVSPRQLLFHMFLAFSTIGVLFLAAWIMQPAAWAQDTHGGLLGEELLDTPEKALDYAERSVQEAYNIWKEPTSNWEAMHDDRKNTKGNQLVVECRRVTEGPFQNSTIHVARAEGILRSVSAQEAYEFIVSPEGLAFIDPSSDPEDYRKTVELFPGWRGETQIEESRLPGFGPLTNPREFVLLSSFLSEERLFVSKSVLHPSRPGASPFYQGDFSQSDTKRAIHTFAVQVEPSTTQEKAVTVKMISYVDLLFVPKTLMSYLSCKAIFPSLYQKLQQAFDEGRHKI